MNYKPCQRSETFEKRPLSKSALICPISVLHSSRRGGTRNIQYISVVNPAKAGLMRLDLESRQGGKHFSKVSICDRNKLVHSELNLEIFSRGE